ncbi:unnamed protein product [Rotaria sp. Silwood2]|nr:unnamed protein product [Rotaria sp. Silwood2]
MSTNDDNVDLLSLNDYNDFENSSNASEDDSIEVASNVDEQENQIIDMTTYLELNSSSDDALEMNGDDNYSSVLTVDNKRSFFDDINDHCDTLDDACSQFNSDASNDDDKLEYHALRPPPPSKIDLSPGTFKWAEIRRICWS